MKESEKMYIDIETLKKITQGAEKIKETENGFEFSRFTDEEIQTFTDSPLLSRTYTTAGIQLCFKTDAEKLRIKLSVQNCCDRSFFALDVIKDGELIGSIKNFDEDAMKGFYSWSNYPLGDFEGSFNLGEGEKNLRIVLPWSVRLFIKEICLDGATFITETPKNDTMLIYGDSITHGYDSIHPMNAYSVKLAKHLECECFIKAVGGDMFREEFAKIKHPLNPKYVTVAYGTNDWGNDTKENFDRNSYAFISNISKNYKDSKIFVLTPIWRKDNTGGGEGFESIHYIGEKLSEICKEFSNTVCINGWDLVPHEENLYGDLRLHPNDEGFEHYFENLYTEIKKHI